MLFCIEVCIAYFFKTGFIRHTFGDYLVVIMLYCFLKSFLNIKPTIMAIVVLIISFTIEFSQLTPFLEYFSLQDNSYAKLILGNSFHTSDLIAYVLGVITLFVFEAKGTTA